MHALALDLRRSHLGLLISLALGCAVGDGDSGSFGTFGSPTGNATTLGNDDNDDAEAGDTSGDGDGDADPGDGDADPGDGDADPGPGCGDGLVGPEEACDGSNLVGETCVSLGFIGGTLGCAEDCKDFDTSNCEMSSCGNGVLDEGELCDGPELNGQTCVSVGFAGGQLGCGDNCITFDVSGCVDASCGNGVIEQGEVCDGNNLGGQSCLSQGFAGGTLLCNGSCTGFNTAGCVNDSGDCCTDNLYPGCQDAGITNCVCALDSFCCDSYWDSLCAQEAVDYCGAIC
jgi:hypothetical protein